MALRGRAVDLERRVNSTADAISLLLFRRREDCDALEDDLEVGAVLGVEAEEAPDVFLFCFADERIMARMF